MTCPRTNSIVRLASGELSPWEERDLREHLETCQTCAAAYSEMCQTWKTLGEWQMDVSDIDLADRVLADSFRVERYSSRSVWLARRWAVPLRAAASIVVAVGLGVVAGRLVPVDESAAIPESPAPLEGLTEALEMIGLASESATGLAFGLEAEEVPEGDEPS
jgi:anti-sigma factor RsiW